MQSQKQGQQKLAVKPIKGQLNTPKASKVTTENQRHSTKNQSKPTKEPSKFDQRFEPANLVNGPLNDYPPVEREPDKLMFADQKLLFANDGNLNILPDSRGAGLDSINLDLNLDNLHANLASGGLAASLGNGIDDALTDNLNSNLNRNLNGNLNSNLNTNLNSNLNTNLHSASLDDNLNFEDINFESQSSQSLLIKQ